MSDEEFEMVMQDKENEADKLLSGWNKLDKEERQTYIKRMNLDTELVSIINGRMVYNNLKKQSFIYKQALRKIYRDGISIRDSFMQSEKFELTNQNEWEDFNIKLAKAMTVSYEQLLKDYLDSPSESYEQEYPEFPLIKRYLKESEMNTLRWNREKMLKAVEDKKLIDKVFLAIYQPGFISNQELKSKLKDEFGRLGIKLSPKATLIENCTLYNVEKASRKIDGKTVSGYELGKMVFTFE